VIKSSGEGAERKNAASVLHLIQKGKHWVLVTLLLSNVITNETLPIVLDRSLGGGWPAILGSTVLIGMLSRFCCSWLTVTYRDQSSSVKSSPSPYAFGTAFPSAPGWPPLSSS
jgi:metal transporter CNNM